MVIWYTTQCDGIGTGTVPARIAFHRLEFICQTCELCVLIHTHTFARNLRHTCVPTTRPFQPNSPLGSPENLIAWNPPWQIPLIDSMRSVDGKAPRAKPRTKASVAATMMGRTKLPPKPGRRSTTKKQPRARTTPHRARRATKAMRTAQAVIDCSDDEEVPHVEVVLPEQTGQKRSCDDDDVYSSDEEVVLLEGSAVTTVDSEHDCLEVEVESELVYEANAIDEIDVEGVCFRSQAAPDHLRSQASTNSPKEVPHVHLRFDGIRRTPTATRKRLLAMGRHLTAASSSVSGDVVGAAECLLAFETLPSRSKGDNAYSSNDGNTFYWQRHFSFATKYAEFINSTMLPGFVHKTQHMATVCRKAHDILHEVRDDCKNVKTYKDAHELKSTREAIRRYALVLFPNLAGTGSQERNRPVLMDETLMGGSLTERQREKEVKRREKDRDAQIEAEQAQLEQEKGALQRQQETIREREKQLREERERRGGGGAVPLPLPVPDEDDGGVAAQRMKAYVRYMAARGEWEAFTIAQNHVCTPCITPEEFLHWSRRQNRKEHTLKAACFLALNPTMKPLDACKMANASGNHTKGPEATSYVIRMQNFTRPQIKWMISQLADYHGKAPASTRERREVECHFTETQKYVMKQAVASASVAEKPFPMAWSNSDMDIASIQTELDDFAEAWQPQTQELSSARFKRVITTTRIFDSNILNDLQQQEIARANLAPLLPKKPIQPTTEADALAQSADEAVKEAFPKRPEKILDEALRTAQTYTAPQEKGLATSVPWASALVENSTRVEDIAGWGRKVCSAKRALPNGWRAFPGAPSTIGLPSLPASLTDSFQYLERGLVETPLNNQHAKACGRGSRATKASTQKAARQILNEMEEQKKALGICVGPTVADAPAFTAPALTPTPTSQVGEAWTKEEDDRLRKVHAESRIPSGYHSWPLIFNAFPGRSEGSVRNRWQRLKENDNHDQEQERKRAKSAAPAANVAAAAEKDTLSDFDAMCEMLAEAPEVAPQTGGMDIDKMAKVLGVGLPPETPPAPTPAEADECKIAPSDNAHPSLNLLPALPREKRNQPNMNNRLNSMVLFSCALEHDRFNLTRSQKLRLVATEAKASVDTTEGSWGIADRSKVLTEIIGSHKTRLVAQALKERNRRGIIGRIRYMQSISAEYERAKQMALDGGIDPRDYPLPLQTACNKWNRLSEAEQEQFLAPAAR